MGERSFPFLTNDKTSVTEYGVYQFSGARMQPLYVSGLNALALFVISDGVYSGAFAFLYSPLCKRAIHRRVRKRSALRE